ncbi:DUF2950 family protein [Variovorax sp. J22R133]|uniref:DUF2950 family protein n=1 Tax=Variovorax brevis TaxID=3053503 RepID=UPI002578FBC8|nr:DUF2950 family protein [Variovorax sp. J22R133]MDM0110746.1 DUF2950 family protein [Variovorax sp. J22R133]
MRLISTLQLRRAVMACVLAFVPAAVVHAQAAYPTPETAADALATALSRGDRDGVRHVLGAQFMRYVPEHSVDADDVYAFLEAWSKAHGIEQVNPTRALMVVGESKWPFPAPIVKSARGWQFDLRAGQAEMQGRRIGRNELAAIGTLQMLCDAQARYALSAGQGKPASRIVSTTGRQDGLYWPDVGGQQSILGPDALIMEADTPPDAALHGYHYRMLPGASDARGCAFVAWPARYGTDGVHSFAISSDRVVRERDLGPATAKSASRLARDRLETGWTPVQQ